MNIPSTVLIEAIEFAKLDPEVQASLASRDKIDKLTVKSIRSEVIGISHEKKLLRIGIYVDYIPKTEAFVKGQDVVIDVLWSPVSGYVIDDVYYYPS